MIAHSLAAAAIAWATVALVALGRPTAGLDHAGLVVAAPVLAVTAGMLRTEAVIFTTVLGVGGVVVAVVGRRFGPARRPRCVGVGGLAARQLDAVLAEQIVGARRRRCPPSSRGRAAGRSGSGWTVSSPPGSAPAPTGEDAAAMVVVLGVLLTLPRAVARRTGGPNGPPWPSPWAPWCCSPSGLASSRRTPSPVC